MSAPLGINWQPSLSRHLITDTRRRTRVSAPHDLCVVWLVCVTHELTQHFPMLQSFLPIASAILEFFLEPRFRRPRNRHRQPTSPRTYLREPVAGLARRVGERGG